MAVSCWDLGGNQFGESRQKKVYVRFEYLDQLDNIYLLPKLNRLSRYTFFNTLKHREEDKTLYNSLVQ